MQHARMKLAEWLSTNDISVPAFADRIGRHKTTVYRWLDGSERPSPSAIEIVSRETGGDVTPNDLYGVTPPEPSEAAQ
jgi:DNA-binding transcriptional regulator YdaS (Cro superfamily)